MEKTYTRFHPALASSSAPGGNQAEYGVDAFPYPTPTANLQPAFDAMQNVHIGYGDQIQEVSSMTKQDQEVYNAMKLLQAVDPDLLHWLRQPECIEALRALQPYNNHHIDRYRATHFSKPQGHHLEFQPMPEMLPPPHPRYPSGTPSAGSWQSSRHVSVAGSTFSNDSRASMVSDASLTYDRFSVDLSSKSVQPAFNSNCSTRTPPTNAFGGLDAYLPQAFHDASKGTGYFHDNFRTNQNYENCLPRGAQSVPPAIDSPNNMGWNTASEHQCQSTGLYHGPSPGPPPHQRLPPTPEWMTEAASKNPTPQKEKIFCPHPQCTRTYTNKNELRKHLAADHDGDNEYQCCHADCSFKSHRISDWKTHHTRSHNGCGINELSCRTHVIHGTRLYWGCNLCLYVAPNVDHYLNHFEKHVFGEKRPKEDCNYSTMMRSLLSQDLTKDLWFEVDPNRRLEWDYDVSRHLQKALEYGIFNGESLSNSVVARKLVAAAILGATKVLSSTTEHPVSPRSPGARRIQNQQPRSLTLMETIPSYDNGN